MFPLDFWPDSGDFHDCHIYEIPRFAGTLTPPSKAGFLFLGSAFSKKLQACPPQSRRASATLPRFRRFVEQVVVSQPK